MPNITIADAAGFTIPPFLPGGESPPPQPKVCFGREELIEKIVGLAENLTPFALIGAGGIGKTSIALTVLHHDRIKKRFGDNRHFIRCDQFPASHSHFLARLSMVIGASVANPEDLTPLRPFLSSREMILFLDNAESILDPQGTNAHEIWATMEELIQFDNVCLCFTSRISTVPPTCKTLEIPTLSIEAARDAFYGIHDVRGRSDLIDDILGQLNSHPLSITILATVAHHNMWDDERLTREWGERRTDILHTQHSNSLAATIELSLASPTFQELGPDARDLLGIVAFFPQGINENNLDWLFPAIPDRGNTFDRFCVLSLTYRKNGFVTMLAPLRDYLCPKDPTSSPLLCAARQSYFHRLRVDIDPSQPGFEEAKWIMSEDVNVEHLLGVFMTFNTDSADVWVACADFMCHLYWHKKRLVALGPKIEQLPDDNQYKPGCLFHLSRLFGSVGNYPEYKRLLVHTLKLRRKEEDDFLVAETLRYLSDANGLLGYYEEGMAQAREALEICERHKHTSGQGRSWLRLAWLLCRDGQLDAAEEAASRAIEHLSDAQVGQFEVCGCHHILGTIYHSKGEIEKAVEQFETAIGIASKFNWHGELFWNNFDQARLFFGEGRFDEAQAHIERAKSYAIDSTYLRGRAMELQAELWYGQRRLAEAKSEALDALYAYKTIGDVKRAENCGTRVLRKIEESMNETAAPHEH